jgi:hypothetical protein
MKRFIWLSLLLIPYWVWIQHPQGTPHLAGPSLTPLVYAAFSALLFLPKAWWLFRLDRDDCLASISRLAWSSIGGLGLVHLLTYAMGYPSLAKLFLGGPAGYAFSGVGMANSIKDVESLPLWVSIVGYTLGVGLTEEAAKAIAARSDIIDGMRTRAAFGFVSGVGFGLAEAVQYSYLHYIPENADWVVYVLRYFFCVGFHGCMSAVAVLSLPHDWWDSDRWWNTALRLLPIAFLHGAYDALLGRAHPIWAGIVATVTILLLPVLLWVQEEHAGEV